LRFNDDGIYPFFLQQVIENFPVYPPEGKTAVVCKPRLCSALATLIPPPPGSSCGGLHFNFFSGISRGTDVLLSMQGLKVMVIIVAIDIKITHLCERVRG
jgi:hypothetical protein